MQHPSLPPIHAGFPQYAPSPTHTPVKSEPLENRFPLQNNGPTYMPTLPGPTLPGPPRPSQTPATVSHHHYNGGPPRPQQPYSSSTSLAPGATSAHQRMPQVDGPSESDSDSATPPPPSQSFAPPRSLHPSLPQPGVGPTTTASEEINSDLDDSDSDAEEEDQEGALGETDIVFCTYDKVCAFLSERDLPIHALIQGRPCQEQVEMCFERRHDTYKRERLSIRKMHLVCVDLHCSSSRLTLLAVNSNGKRITWTPIFIPLPFHDRPKSRLYYF